MDPDADAQPLPPRATIEHEEKGRLVHQGRRDPQQDAALMEGLADQAEVAELEIADTTVDEPARPRRRPPAHGSPFQQGHPEPAHGRVPGHAGSDDAASENEQILHSGTPRAR